MEKNQSDNKVIANQQVEEKTSKCRQAWHVL